MRVGVVGPYDEDDFARHIGTTLEAMGHHVVALGPATPMPAAVRLRRSTRAAASALLQHPRLGERAERRHVERAVASKLDLVITVQSLRPATVRSLSNAGIRTALWFPDHVSNLGPLWMFDAPYDGLFFKEPLLVERVRNTLGLPVWLLPEACNPDCHRVPDSTERRATVAVVGNMYATRLRLLDRLRRDGYELEVFGNPIPRWSGFTERSDLSPRGYVRGVDKAIVYRTAGVVLNSMHPAEIDGVNCRLFEAAACGGTVVSEYRSSISDHFEIGHEIEVFRTYEELRAALDRLLADLPASRGLGDRAALRAAKDHTYEARLTELLAMVSGGRS